MENVWVLVLAAGEGRRLAPLTRSLYGRSLPKQFADLVGGRSLLQTTLDRMAPIAPPERTAVVVPGDHAALARGQLAPWPGVHVVEQPANLDTGPGILLGLAHVLERAPAARVVIVPSDHWIPQPTPFIEAVRQALTAPCGAALTLLGVQPEGAETEYGWIVAGLPARGSASSVEAFVEKPAPDVARHLLAHGGLWNTFVMAGTARAIWHAAAERLPEHAAAIREAARSGRMREAYSRLGPANFSRDVLQYTPGLAVVPVRGSGWCDWGSTARVLESLDGLPQGAALRARLAAGGRPAESSQRPRVVSPPVAAKDASDAA